VKCEEIEAWEENGQKWRLLNAAFDDSIDTHCAVQKFYFDDKGMLQRHDYFTDVAEGNAAYSIPGTRRRSRSSLWLTSIRGHLNRKLRCMLAA
jgi:hypothetical protein